MQTKDVLSTNTAITKALLVCGVVAGPLFTVAWIVEGATRVNCDPLRYPISSLSLGNAGWMQIATFIITGLLSLSRLDCAVLFGLPARFGDPRWSDWLA